MTTPPLLPLLALAAALAGPATALWIGRDLTPDASRGRQAAEGVIAALSGAAAGGWAYASSGQFLATMGAALGLGALVANALLDLRTSRLSDLLSLLAGAGALLAGPGLFGAADRMGQLYGGAIAAGMLVLAGAFVRLRRPGVAALGSGDIALAAAGGLFIGGFGAAPALGAAAAATLPLALVRKGAAPFGPGIAAGVILVGSYAAWRGGVL
jgi:prepilin signal peptidase PulO-like enzyme (type II secretory pathway)